MDTIWQPICMFGSWPFIIFFAGYVWYKISNAPDTDLKDGTWFVILLLILIGIMCSVIAVYIIPILLICSIILGLCYGVKRLIELFVKKFLNSP